MWTSKGIILRDKWTGWWDDVMPPPEAEYERAREILGNHFDHPHADARWTFWGHKNRPIGCIWTSAHGELQDLPKAHAVHSRIYFACDPWADTEATGTFLATEAGEELLMGQLRKGGTGGEKLTEFAS